MSTPLGSGVERRLESCETSGVVTLIVGVEDCDSESVLQRVRDSGAEIEDKLPLDYLAVSIPEENLEELCNLSVVTSVDIEGKGTTLSESDF